MIAAGDTVQISATGSWLGKRGETGPEGSGSGPDDCPAGALVARVAKFHQRTCIGAGNSLTAERAGYVWLYQSDGGDAVQSSGAVQVTLTGGHCSTLPREGMHPVGATLTAERREGKSPEEAIREACRMRFRPIMMTTCAAMLGALPLAIGAGDGAELRTPLGIAIVGGLMLSQLLTLYTTPVVYLYLDRFRLWCLRMRRPAAGIAQPELQ